MSGGIADITKANTLDTIDGLYFYQSIVPIMDRTRRNGGDVVKRDTSNTDLYRRDFGHKHHPLVECEAQLPRCRHKCMYS